MFGAKVQIAALEKGLDFDLIMVPYDSARGYDPKHPEVLRINPKRQVPVLTHGPVEIFDSTQIFEYLEDMAPTPPLWPRDPIARAGARNLEHQSDEVYFPHIIKLMGLQDAMGHRVCDRCHRRRESSLRGDGETPGIRLWLAGSYSFADIAFYMAALFGERQGAPLTASTPRLLAWRERMGQRAPVKTVVSAMAAWLKSAGRPVPTFMAALQAKIAGT